MIKLDSSPFDVITVGDVFLDIVMTGFPAWPQPGEEAFAQDLFHEAGGGAAITACGLARLGARVGTLAMVGQSDGQWLIERLEQCGVSTSLIHRDANQATGTTVSVSTAQDRSFFTYNGANTSLIGLLGEPATREQLCQASHVHFACPLPPDLLSGLTDLIHAANHTVSIDVGWHPDWLTNKACWKALKKMDLFFPNEREAELMTGERDPEAMLQKLGAAGFRRVALKLGEAGSLAWWDEKLVYCPPYPVSPVDTTGAGDCFNAGVIRGWLDHQPPLRCLRLGNFCGAISTTELGGISAFPTRSQCNELWARET
ncbi:MAG: carbohydrate kinase family protein [Acidobacteria bacterium]|nr:carbohydrate kinase family protein [Acidobacteriota bacterium]